MFGEYKKYAYPAYIAALILAALYVKNVVSTQTVTVRNQPQQEVVQKQIPAEVWLKVENEKATVTYHAKYANTVSFINFLNNLRETKSSKENPENPVFTYERTEYVTRTVIDEVNGTKATDNLEWKVFDGSDDITNQIKTLNVADGKTYTLRLIRK